MAGLLDQRCTDGLILSKKRLGKRPIRKKSSTSGTSMAISPGRRSFRLAASLSGLVIGPCAILRKAVSRYQAARITPSAAITAKTGIPRYAAQQDGELADKAVETRQPGAAHDHHQEEATEDRHALPQAAEVVQHARVAPLVEQADHEEERAGADAVVDHLQH